MAKVSVFIAVSLDGQIARQSGAIDWLDEYQGDPTQDYGYRSHYNGTSVVLLGRKTFEQALTFGEWPYAGKRCVVFSRSGPSPKLNEAIERTRVEWVTEDPVAFVSSLKQKEPADICLVGGGILIGALLEADLVDEWIQTVVPTFIGKGIGLTGENALKPMKSWKLVSHRAYSSGLVQLVFDRHATDREKLDPSLLPEG